jgi:hypothetical protein
VRDRVEGDGYVANIKVERVVDASSASQVTNGGTMRGGGSAPPKSIVEVAHINVKAKSLESLKVKITGHVGLLEED